MVQILSYKQSTQLLHKFAIPLAQSHLCRSPHEALIAAKHVGYPLVAKLISQKALHKTEKNAVVVGIKDSKELTHAWIHFHRIDPQPEGVLVQKQLSGVELFAGAHPDPVFGPVVGFGMGGVLVEVAKDIHFGITPFQRSDARRIVEQSKIFPLLSGYRGQHLASVDDVVDLLMNLSKLARSQPRLSIDLNPIFLSHGSLHAADWRVMTE